MSNRTASLELDSAPWLITGDETYELSLYSFPPEERRGIVFGRTLGVVIDVASDNPDHDGVFLADIEDYDDDSRRVTLRLR